MIWVAVVAFLLLLFRNEPTIWSMQITIWQINRKGSNVQDPVANDPKVNIQSEKLSVRVGPRAFNYLLISSVPVRCRSTVALRTEQSETENPENVSLTTAVPSGAGKRHILIPLSVSY